MSKKLLPITVLMITLNEEHYLKTLLPQLKKTFSQIIILDSYSKDKTIDIALSNKVDVFQRKFKSFGDQWNYALNNLDIKNKWTLKLDPDERISENLMKNIRIAIKKDKYQGFSFERRLWFMESPLPIKQEVLRLWRTNYCKFLNLTVNEQPVVQGKTKKIAGILEHLDSPNLEHWIEKQNRYTSLEAINLLNSEYKKNSNLFGNSYQRRIWIKRYFWRIPFRYEILYFYFLLLQGAFIGGRSGLIWCKLRIETLRLIEYKFIELKKRNLKDIKNSFNTGDPDSRVEQA